MMKARHGSAESGYRMAAAITDDVALITTMTTMTTMTTNPRMANSE
ncbi:MAG: hypothetical protein ACRD29_19440 [Acidimicrobiales bacterium]